MGYSDAMCIRGYRGGDGAVATLTHETRERIRQARSEAVRQQCQPLRGQRYCGNCGTEVENWTIGCGSCKERHKNKKKRGINPPDPAWFNYHMELERQRYFRALQDAAARRRWWVTA